VRLVQVVTQVTIDRATGGCCVLRERLGDQQLDATESACGLADQAYAHGGVVGG
jgi:hypothetical protein